ncbi:MAG: NAD(P)-binding domain-containing protein, partial [Burkholderiales bacterium]|nr:NAD(P)-binding domain-containing protein [Burkholderiales bacterium]
MNRIAFLGLGAMGSRMAARLVAAGHTVTVWNRSPAATHPLGAAGAAVAATPRAAVADTDIAISMVFDDAASQAVWLDADTGAIHALRPDAVAIEAGTLTPAWVHRLGYALASAGQPLPITEAVATRFVAARDAGFAD